MGAGQKKQQTVKRGRGRPSIRDENGFTPHERILRTAIFEAIAVAQSEDRKPTCNDVRRLLEGRGLGKQAKTRIMTVVRMCGLQTIWASRGARLREYLDEHRKGKPWSQHLEQAHRGLRLHLQRLALDHPDWVGRALDEGDAMLKRLLRDAGVQPPIWPKVARATLERATGRRSGPQGTFDRRAARLRERLEEAKREREQMEAWRKATGSEAYSPSERRLDGEAAWKRHKAAQRSPVRGEDRDEAQTDAAGNMIPPPEPNHWDLQHQARRQREEAIWRKPNPFGRR